MKSQLSLMNLQKSAALRTQRW